MRMALGRWPAAPAQTRACLPRLPQSAKACCQEPQAAAAAAAAALPCGRPSMARLAGAVQLTGRSWGTWHNPAGLSRRLHVQAVRHSRGVMCEQGRATHCASATARTAWRSSPCSSGNHHHHHSPPLLHTDSLSTHVPHSQPAQLHRCSAGAACCARLACCCTDCFVTCSMSSVTLGCGTQSCSEACCSMRVPVLAHRCSSRSRPPSAPCPWCWHSC